MAEDDDLAFYKAMTPADRAKMDAQHRKETPEQHAQMMEGASQDKAERKLAFRWHDPVHALELAEQGYSHGMKNVVLPAIFLCAVNNLPLPEWLTKAFCLQYLRGFHGKLKSWDDVWGRAYDFVMEAHSRGEPITDELFEKVGRERGIGGRETTKKQYSAARRKRQNPSK